MHPSEAKSVGNSWTSILTAIPAYVDCTYDKSYPVGKVMESTLVLLCVLKTITP